MKNKFIILLFIILSFGAVNVGAFLNDCDSRSDYFDKNHTSIEEENNPTEPNTPRQKTNPDGACYYECEYPWIHDGFQDCNIKASCASESDYFVKNNADYWDNNPTSTNVAWQNTYDTEPCYYTCEAGWVGDRCDQEVSCVSDNIEQDNTDTYNVGTPTEANQAWQSNDASKGCYFKCNKDWTGSECRDKVPGNCQDQPTIANGNVIFEFGSPYYVDSPWQQVVTTGDQVHPK